MSEVKPLGNGQKRADPANSYLDFFVLKVVYNIRKK